MAAQLAGAHAVLPRDAAILFEEGYYHQALAAPRVQAAGVANYSSVGSAETNLKAARTLCRKSLDADPGFAEARVRHGAVLVRR